MKNKQIRILLIVAAVILGIVGYRVVSNLMANAETAKRSSGDKTAVVTVSHAKRERIQPKFKFSGTLVPVWQADVAAKVDGRIERIFVDEGDAVAAGQALLELEQSDTRADVMIAKGAYIDAKTNLEKAKTDVSRYEMLYKEGAVSKESLDNMQRGSWRRRKERFRQRTRDFSERP